MKSIQLVLLGLFVALMGITAASKAEDIDIYSGLSGAVGVPNVLIILDNTANWNSPFDAEKSALVSTVSGLSETVNIGLMMFPETGNPNDNVDGGYVHFGVRPMTGANKGALGTMVNALDKLNDKGNNATYGLAMHEAYVYFAGGGSLSGFGKVKRDYAGNTVNNSLAAGLPGNPFTSASSTTYISPMNNECQKNFIIFISNGPANDNTSATNTATSLLTGVGGNTTTIALSPNGAQSNVADEWARFLSSNDINSTLANTQTVRTYTVDVNPGTTGGGPAHTALLKSMASHGKGKYFAVTGDASAIAQALLKILNEVQAVNSVFSSSSLPVSVNAQGTYLNQIYMGMFRPDENGMPRWLGNLKQYQFSYDVATDTLKLADSLGESAISAGGTGFISPNAVSFWTTKNTAQPDLGGGFWRNKPAGSGGGYDLPDGELVEKGGAAQMLRLANLNNTYTTTPGTSNPRKLFTYCPSGSCTAQLSAAANAFDSSNTLITDAVFGTGTTRTNMIQWIRGHDYKGDESGPGSTVSNVRPSLHGDVLHSRPTIINYGDSTGVVVFYGSNDGAYRAINGNQSGTGAGSELWGFIPTEFFGKLKRLHDNSPVLLLPSTPTGILPAPQRKNYFADGPTGVYQKMKADGTTDTAYLYLAMRRGGRLIYTLDVSTPTNPKFLWKITNTGDFAELGQTWSQPKVANVKGYANPVLIFGAGYDTAEDSEPPTADTMGRGIFIVDAITGTMVWSATYGTSSACSGTTTKATCSVAGMNYSIPADITLVDRDSDGKVDRLYAVDTGGNVWRVDLQPTVANFTPNHWQVNNVAALGCSAGACEAGTTPRKFFYPVDVVPTNSYDAILVGSGDREHPLYSNLSYGITNRFYMLKDLTGNAGSSTATIEASLFDATSTAYVDSSSFKGFYVTLRAGEKVVNAPTTVAGYTYFGTNQPTAPSANSCTATLGIARGYSIKPLAGTYTSTEFDGGGLPPSPVSGLVNITVMVNGVATTRLVPFLIGGGGSPDCVGSDCSSRIVRLLWVALSHL